MNDPWLRGGGVRGRLEAHQTVDAHEVDGETTSAAGDSRADVLTHIAECGGEAGPSRTPQDGTVPGDAHVALADAEATEDVFLADAGDTEDVALADSPTDVVKGDQRHADSPATLADATGDPWLGVEA